MKETKIIKIKDTSDIPENFTGAVEYPSGTKFWYKDGLRHREDGPAVEYSSGSKQWYLEDKHYAQINLNNYVVLDSYKGNHNLTWYKLLTKDKVIEWPDIPGLITK